MIEGLLVVFNESVSWKRLVVFSGSKVHSLFVVGPPGDSHTIGPLPGVNFSSG